MAQEGDVKLEILDAQTRQPLAHTEVDAKIYVTATEGKDFAIRATLLNHESYKARRPHLNIRIHCKVDGESIGYVSKPGHCYYFDNELFASYLNLSDCVHNSFFL